MASFQISLLLMWHRNQNHNFDELEFQWTEFSLMIFLCFYFHSNTDTKLVVNTLRQKELWNRSRCQSACNFNWVLTFWKYIAIHRFWLLFTLNSLFCLDNLQTFTKYSRLTLVFMWNSPLREEFNFCFSRVFG